MMSRASSWTTWALSVLAATVATGQTATRVAVVKPERKAIRQVVEQPASLEALESAPIFSKVAGYVERVAVDIGDRVTGPQYGPEQQLVKPGQVLLQLSLPEVQKEVQQKQAAIGEARALVDQAYAQVRVSEAKAAIARIQIHSAEAGIRRAQAQFDRQQSEHERLKKLVAQNALAPKVVDEALESVKLAQAGLDESQSQLESTKAAVREAESLIARAQADHAAAEAHVKVTEAALAQSQAMLDYGALRAPFAGIVSRRHVHTGHFVQPAGQGLPLLEVTRVDIVRVLIDVPENVAPLIDAGDPVTIRFPSAALPSIDAQITRLSWALDKATRTLKAEVELRNTTGKLRPGMYAYASIVAAEQSAAWVLPLSAVVSEKQAVFCACVENGQVVRKNLQLGLRTATEVEVVQGLSGSEQVVRSNAASLAVGQSVEVLPPLTGKP